ncbi:NADH-quinone oxidoreductase subunit H [Dactylosporangium aurantiacum]|uniref:NADH-quinone oxidoreductase subunit H n=1 Tax=Dactylosporangium aurantiacum TaxID=35754 RepID=A0A9Q9MRK1_9ACTN|nr:NADH-quinone oxidoreductase subunit H [Dactylosporangium aurantiacum]MDG6110308.1 NADH-quinone oxidoreductase subunit H [Dactylosporangium aurantiacum]UWZ58572.1 NADH-quinone oxidoreductase subunit H [Dactylosporangium aurantiacum]
MSGAPAWWVLPAAGLVLLFAVAAAALDGVLDPAGRGQSFGWRLGRPVWETARLLRQRRRTTVAPDALLWRAGTAGPLVIALLMAVVVPIGDAAVADPQVGVVWFNALDVALWLTVWCAGWGANSVYGLVGGYRFLAQALGYELPLMFALTAPAVAAGSLQVSEIVTAQHGLWFVVQMPAAFVVFLLGVAGFSLWGPLAYPVGRDLAGGVLAEPSGVDRLVLLTGRYALLAVGAGMATALFLGGGAGPLLPGWLWSLIKTAVVLAALVAVRRRGPTLRADRVMRLAWLVVLPVTLLQLLVVSVLALRGV